jgi:hypothetical protein
MTLLLSGCGQPMQKAGGKVLIDGVPAKDGNVTFYPVAGGRPATAFIQPDGTFELSFEKLNDGLPPGEYKVCIVVDVWKETMNPKQREAMEEMLKKQGAIDDVSSMSAGQLLHIVPPEYNTIETTPLREKVVMSDKPQHYVYDIKVKKK